MSAFHLYKGIWILICAGLTVWFVDFNLRAGEFYNWRISGGDCGDLDRWRDCDPMAMTGFLGVLIGLWITTLADKSQTGVLRRWFLSGVTDRDPATLPALIRDLQRKTVLWQVLMALAILFILMTGYLLFFQSLLLDEYILGSAVCATVVGARMGRGISHGLLGRSLGRHGVRIHMLPGHPDATAGLGTVGNFYLLQALPTLLPILYLMAWIAVIPTDDDFLREYADWIPIFGGLLVVALAVFALSFALPLLWFRRQILTIKAQTVHPRIRTLRARLQRARAGGKPTFFDGDSQAIMSEIIALMRLPNWPISPATRRVFFSTLALPIVSGIIGWVIPAVTDFLMGIF